MEELFNTVRVTDNHIENHMKLWHLLAINKMSPFKVLSFQLNKSPTG